MTIQVILRQAQYDNRVLQCHSEPFVMVSSMSWWARCHGEPVESMTLNVQVILRQAQYDNTGHTSTSSA